MTSFTGQMQSRRAFLTTAVGAGVAGLSGCLGGGVSDAGKRQFEANPISEDLAERPTLGEDRTDTSITLVEFSDPSCTYCASFHENAFQQIQSEWIDTGEATMYDLVFPVVAHWGELAMHALFEVHSRDPELYWDLKASYLEHQDELSDGTVVDRTASFLSESDVDVGAVTQAMETEAHADRISADTDTADAVGIDGVPTTFVFVDGEFVTTLGDSSFDAYQSAVEGHE